LRSRRGAGINRLAQSASELRQVAPEDPRATALWSQKIRSRPQLDCRSFHPVRPLAPRDAPITQPNAHRVRLSPLPSPPRLPLLGVRFSGLTAVRSAGSTRSPDG